MGGSGSGAGGRRQGQVQDWAALGAESKDFLGEARSQSDGTNPGTEHPRLQSPQRVGYEHPLVLLTFLEQRKFLRKRKKRGRPKRSKSE